MDDLRSLNSLGDIKFAVRRIDELEAKLAKADRLAEVLNDLLQNRGHCFIRIAGREDWDEDATEALKDFKGQKDE
jgi:hypothetical protein